MDVGESLRRLHRETPKAPGKYPNREQGPGHPTRTWVALLVTTLPMEIYFFGKPLNITGDNVMFKFARTFLIGSAAAVPLALASMTASAGTANTSFNVTATVINSCKISATNLSFGNYDPTSATNTTGSSTISATCTKGDSFTLALNKGLYGAFTGRIMQDGATPADQLVYNLYTTSGYTTVWGDGTGSTATVSGTGAGPGTPVVSTVYGQIAAAQNVPAGSYSDTIQVTITY
jgi:spore coat protein U domain-containing protein, fimbrial subunit CupE1/2/3/6